MCFGPRHWLCGLRMLPYQQGWQKAYIMEGTKEIGDGVAWTVPVFVQQALIGLITRL